jgi:N-acetylglucosaminyldiphosphoundecaprenol N-acetyl-beta-D-mannosaminyltransferase
MPSNATVESVHAELDDPRRLEVGPATIDFVALTDVAVGIAHRRVTGGIHLCNAYTLALAGEQPTLAAALGRGALRLPDGMPLVWWARRHGVPSAERVYGPDLMEAVLDVGRSTGLRHFLYGSTPEVLARLTTTIEQRWPGARVVGAESPPFRDLTDEEVRASVQRAVSNGADVIWVGMGTPKQDHLVDRMASTSDLTFVAIGAAFDFIAGTKKQAPRWMMRIGMEWFYRLVTEPRRLWRRYVVYNVKFLRLLWSGRGAVAG